MKAATFIPFPPATHLDHLAPLSALLNIPLLVTDHETAELARKFYPQVITEVILPVDAPATIVSRFDTIISCHSKHLINEMLSVQEAMQNKSVLPIWCPHGNSDKGRREPLIDILKSEQVILHYGSKMLDFIKERCAINQECQYIPIGNYRHIFYEQNKAFYKELLPNFDNRATTLLYAPTWNDYEKNGSMHATLPRLIQSLPKHINLLVKIHPNETQNLETLRQIFAFEDVEGVYFLENYPPIYPILDFVDGYIGDMSSIGYDFLYFNKPMFCVGNENFALHSCGESIDLVFEQSSLNKVIDREKFGVKRKNLYTYTFDQMLPIDELWKSMLSAHEKWNNLVT